MKREFTWVEGLAICLGMIGVQLGSEVLNQWGLYFYSPSEGVGRTVYVAVGSVWVIFLVGTLWDAVTDPLVGVWSDNTRTRPGWLRLIPLRGRRRPFIFWGSIFMIFTSVLFWYPPVEEKSVWNLVYGTVLLCLHWTMFTVTMVPLISLGPEIARSERARVIIGTWTAVGMIVGLTIAAVTPGILIEVFDPARIEGGHSAVGYRRVALLFALISFVLFQAPVWLIKERYDSEKRERTAPLPKGELLRAVLTNRPFIVYAIGFLLFSMGFMAAQRVLPYWAELGLGGSEETVTYLMLPFIVTALASLAVIPLIERLLGVKYTMLLAFVIIASGMPFMYVVAKADISTTTKVILGGALFAYCGIGQGIIYVMLTPIMGECIDYDEIRTGERRESLYNGLSGFAWKAAMGGAIILVSQSMHLWGNEPGNSLGVLLIGPFSGFLGFLGLLVMLFYPKLHVTREHQTE